MHAQSNADTGTVLDVSGKPIPGAVVSVLLPPSVAYTPDTRAAASHGFLVLLPLLGSVETPMSHNTAKFRFTGVFN
jgi:hypothetical protein